MKLFFVLAASLFFVLGTISSSLGQEWKGIVPLVSTCEDVKRVFSIDHCRKPWTKMERASYNVVIDFANAGGEWDVSTDTVVSVMVLFNDLPSLFTYTTDFRDFTIVHEADAPEILLYNNPKKGVRLTVQTAAAKGLYISSIFVYPSKENATKFARKTRTSGASVPRIPCAPCVPWYRDDLTTEHTDYTEHTEHEKIGKTNTPS